jgi:opacity protein-like surface antigen
MGIAQLRLASAVLCGLIAQTSFAAGLTTYVGLGLGNTTAEVSGSSGQVTSSGAGYRIVAGSQINPMFSIEAEYVDLGQFTDATSNVSAKGLGASGVITLPVSGMFSIYGRGGLARIETTVTPLSVPNGPLPLSDTVVDVSLGYGIQADVAPNASLRLSWDRYKSSVLAGTFTNRINMNSSALLIYRF